MPWLSEEICIKEAQTQNTTMPGLSLVQWMNMNKQQNPSLASIGIQSEYLRSPSNPALQNLGAADLARQLYVQNHLLQQNSVQLGAPKFPQQVQPTNELQKLQQQSLMSQSFAQSDIAFNSIDSAINDFAVLNRNSLPSAHPSQRMRTFTKVYKRGAEARSIDIGRFSGYEELKYALARMFGIEGQLEDRQRIGWKLVYRDNDDDILVLGDDPWEEFVNCVKCISILSPQEEQQMSLDGDLANTALSNQACSSVDGRQMSLDGDLANTALSNQACSSVDGRNAWRPRNDQNPGNPSISFYDQLE